MDIGCDQAVIRTILQNQDYTGVGMTEEAAVKMNLEDPAGLPFADGTWNSVLCLDTLEHLNNLHLMCDEVFRVASEHVIVSLPNCWVAARRSIAKGSGTIHQYGLTASPVQDRHKWFFNTEDACGFLQSQTRRRVPRVELLELVALENRRPWINRIWRRAKHPFPQAYLNLYPHTVVGVFQVSR